jgi:hypothetical protein
MGDALFHIAWAAEHERAKPSREMQRDRDPARENSDDAVMDEDEII